MKVILFDIDGTLIHDGGAGKLAMIKAFQEIFGICHHFDTMAGKTDPGILKQAIQSHNIKEETNKIKHFKEYYLELLAKNIKKDLLGKKIYPGVRELLDQLNKYKNVKLGLLTGNLKTSAYIKLAYFDLEHYFNFGAFGDDSILRDDLLPYALKRCNDRTKLNSQDVVVIGDTPNDIRCARINGSKSIGVATGRYSTEELIQKGADFVLKDLTNTRHIISWVLNDKDYFLVHKLDIPEWIKK